MTVPALYVFSGLPGTGKSTLARALASKTGAMYLRIDTVERALTEFYGLQVEGQGYELSYQVAADNLQLGNSVIADCVNPIPLTREQWSTVAENARARLVNIELRCSDKQEHQRRVEERRARYPDDGLPDWPAVLQRDYAQWQTYRVIIDTAGKTVAQSIEEITQIL